MGRIARVPRVVMARPASAWRTPVLTAGPRVRPIRRTPVEAYTQLVQGVPLQPASSQSVVAAASGGGGGGGGGTSPALVQSASNHGTSSPLSVTLPGGTTAGNALLIAIGTLEALSNPTVSAITLGGAGTFASAEGVNIVTGADAEIWYGLDIAGSQTAVSISFNAGSGGTAGLTALVMEWSGLATSAGFDQKAGASGSGTSFSSGATGTLGQASEVVIGVIAAAGGSSNTISGPASPWTDLTQVNSSTTVAMVAGYQVVSSVAGLSYAGTLSNAKWSSVIATFKAASSSPTPPAPGGGGTASVSLGPTGLGVTWYPSQVTLSTTTGLSAGFDGSVANLYLGPVVAQSSLLGTVSGGNGIVAAGLPAIQPGQYLIAQWSGANAGDAASMNLVGTMDALFPGAGR